MTEDTALRIDAHCHFVADHPDFTALVEELDLRIVNQAFHHDPRFGDWRRMVERFGTAAREHPERYWWCTSFDLPQFDDPDYAVKAIGQLYQDVADGAVACKIWKSLGLRWKDPHGHHVLCDHPIMEPIFASLEEMDVPVIAHIGEPRSCWQPLVETDPCYGYFSKRPELQFHGRTDVPSHAEVTASVDRLIERHPNMRVIGAHLGSHEYDVGELGRRFDRYPNYSVDTAARPGYLAQQDRDTVRRFFMEWPDRIIWGTDVGCPPQSTMSDQGREAKLNWIRAKWLSEIAFYGTDAEVTVQTVRARGLALPEDVLQRFFVENARKWLSLA